jgi:hypothetical protein
MMKKYSLIIGLIFAFGSSCTKRTLPNISNSPVFAFDGFINNQKTQIIAGDSGQFMFTNFITNLNLGTTLSGRFAQENCFNCEPYLDISIQANKLVNGVPQFSLDSFASNNKTLFSRSLDSVGGVSQPDSFRFSLVNASANNVISWGFDDGSIGDGSQKDHVYAQLNKYYNVTVNTAGSLGFTSVTQQFKNSIPVIFDPLIIMSVDSNTKTISAVGGDCNCKSIYYWGDGTWDSVSTSSIVVNHTYINAQGLNRVVTKVSYFGNDSSTARAKFNFDGEKIEPSFDIKELKGNFVTAKPRLNLNDVVVTYKANGKTYKSFKNSSSINQSNNPIITNVISEAYLNNSNEQKTIKVDGNLDTYLYNELNPSDSILIKSKKLTFAIARPN